MQGDGRYEVAGENLPLLNSEGATIVKLEHLTAGALVAGIVPGDEVIVVAVSWHGQEAVTLTYQETSGQVSQRLLFRADEAGLELGGAKRRWTVDGDGAAFRLAAEARRIRLAYLFDPMLAVRLSLLEPLPHQIRAVYGEMLPRQPLRFLLADDPGAGKTIMAGLFIKELMLRGDLRRCLVVAPGGLVAQWQDELSSKFSLQFSILTREAVEASLHGDPFAEEPLLIARMDQLSRSEELQSRLRSSEWDLIIVDEAHRMSAHYQGNEVRETQRYRLGKLLGGICRHFLLLTATPNYHLFRVHPACTRDGCFRAATSTVPPGNDNGSARQHLRAGQLPHGDGTAVRQFRVEGQLRLGAVALAPCRGAILGLGYGRECGPTRPRELYPIQVASISPRG